MTVYDVREDAAGRFHVVRVDLDTGQATWLPGAIYGTRPEAQRDADARNRHSRNSGRLE